MLPCSQAPMRAFSLIEILIALAIFMIGMVGVMAALTSAVGLHRRAVDQASASFLAQSILVGAQAQAAQGATPDEISTRENGRYVFRPSTNYPAYDYKIICTPLGEREYRLTVEIRLRPLNDRPVAASDTEPERENVRLETLLLAR